MSHNRRRRLKDESAVESEIGKREHFKFLLLNELYLVVCNLLNTNCNSLFLKI
jgi:hypothetical protein